MLQITPETEKYITEHISAEDPVLEELNRRTHLETVNPQMVTGHLQGRFLEMVSLMICPQNILEIGTFTGYSAICLAKGLLPDGHLYTIEKNDELAPLAAEFFEKSGMSGKIIQISGNARQIIPGMNLLFDLVYIDAEKSEYPEYYNLVIDKIRPGGWIIADNVLWGEKILTDPAKADHSTRGILEFNELVHNDDRVDNLILPIRDGVMMIRKK